jgi:hypothetical protein
MCHREELDAIETRGRLSGFLHLHFFYVLTDIMASDLDQLIEMGFDKERAQLAVTKTGGCKFLPFRLIYTVSYSLTE